MINFTEFLENNQKFKILIKDIILTKDEIVSAVDNISRGLGSITQGPLEVYHHPSEDKYELSNGYHRIIEALFRGKKEIDVISKGTATWDLPKDIFSPDFDKKYFGMEDFVEEYILRKI